MSLIQAMTGQSSFAPVNAVIHNEDIVEAVILNIGFPYKYLQEIDAHNATIEETASKTGIKKPLKKPTHKEGGISLDIAITYKEDVQGIETDFDEDLASVKELYTSIHMLTPIQFKERGWNLSYERKGGKIVKGAGGDFIGLISEKGSEPKIIIDDIYPNPQVETYFENNKPVMTAAEITDADLDDAEKGEDYQKILEKENKRLEGWEQLEVYWKNCTEEEAKAFLLLSLSSRLLLHDKDIKKFIPYYMPTVGMKFNALVSRKAKYFHLETFKWDRTDRGYKYFNKGVEPVTDEDVANAERISRQKMICFAS